MGHKGGWGRYWMGSEGITAQRGTFAHFTLMFELERNVGINF